MPESGARGFPWCPSPAGAEPAFSGSSCQNDSPSIATRNATRYTQTVIKSFRHKGLQAYFERGTKAGIQAAHAAKLARLLARLDDAQSPGDMNLPGWGLHPLHGSLANHWAVSVNGNWRMTFTFEGTDAVLLDYLDYH